MDQVIPKKIALFINGKTEPHPEYQPIEINQIQFIEAGSVDCLFCNCLNYFANPEQILIELMKRIKYGGEITVEGDEIYEVVRDILVGAIEITDINTYLYEGKNSASSGVYMGQLLKDNGFSILEKDIDNRRFMVKGKRNR